MADSKISNRPITLESNRNGRFESESNLEASQVPSPKITFYNNRKINRMAWYL